MKKRFLFIPVLILILSFSFAVFLSACEKSDNGDNDGGDDGYTFEIHGLQSESAVITKLQVKELFETKPVIRGSDNPVYASDKTDDYGNKIPHTVKGVYLDDLLDIYCGGAVSGAYSAITFQADDGYETLITQETYSIEHGGSPMIIAFEYDGNELSPSSSSGALRVVFDLQTANSWIKKLKKIIFNDAALQPPSVEKVYFAEALNGFDGSFNKAITTGTGSTEYTFYGISIKKLLENGILTATETDKMYINAWDYITNGTDAFYREYTSWKSYEYYNDAYLVNEEQPSGGTKAVTGLAPVFDGINILKGMKIKNVAALSVGKSAVVSLKVAFTRFDTEKSSNIKLSTVLTLAGLTGAPADSLKITAVSGAMQTLSFGEAANLIISKTESGYKVIFSGAEAVIKSVELIKAA